MTPDEIWELEQSTYGKTNHFNNINEPRNLEPALAGYQEHGLLSILKPAEAVVRSIGNDKGFNQNYNEIDERNKKLLEENPTAYYSGAAAGIGTDLAIGSLIPPLAAARGAVGTAQLGKLGLMAGIKSAAPAIARAGVTNAGLGAVQSAAQAGGAENASDFAKEVLTGSALGFGLGVLGQGAIEGASGIKNILATRSLKNTINSVANKTDDLMETIPKKSLLQNIEEKTLNIGLGMRPETQDIIRKSASKMDDALRDTPSAIAQDYAGKFIPALENKIADASKLANSKLRNTINPTEGAQNRDDIINSIRGIQDGMKKSGSFLSAGDEVASQKLDDTIARINSMELQPSDGSPMFTESQIKEIIGGLDNDINSWSAIESTSAQNGLKQLRGNLNSKLRDTNINPEYDKAQSEVARLMEMKSGRSGLDDQFKLDQKFNPETRESFYSPTDTAINKFQNITRGNKETAFNVLNAGDQELGTDFAQRSILNNIARTTEGGSPQGSSFPNLYADISRAAIGGAIGGGAGVYQDQGFAGGAALGAAAGAGINKYGNKIAKEYLIKRYSNSSPALINMTQGTQFQPLLINALLRGGQGLAEEDYKLSNQYPQYRELKK